MTDPKQSLEQFPTGPPESLQRASVDSSDKFVYGSAPGGSVNAGGMGDPLLQEEVPLVRADSSPVRTIPIIILLFIVLILDEVQLFIEWFEDDFRFILIPCCVFLVIACSYVAFRVEHRNMQLRGYLDFFRRTEVVSTLPVAISGVFVAIISMLYTFLEWDIEYFWTLQKEAIMQIAISIGNFAILLSLGIYMYRCVSHNISKPMPDAYHSQLPPSLDIKSLSSHSSSWNKKPSTLIKKQASVIGYLENQVKSLSEEILRLKELNKDANNEVLQDRDHLLAAKQQELRALKVEQDILRENLAKSEEEQRQQRKSLEMLTVKQKESVEEIAELQQEVNQVKKENYHLQVMVEVERDGLKQAQTLIDQFSNDPERSRRLSSISYQKRSDEDDGPRSYSPTSPPPQVGAGSRAIQIPDSGAQLRNSKYGQDGKEDVADT